MSKKDEEAPGNRYRAAWFSVTWFSLC